MQLSLLSFTHHFKVPNSKLYNIRILVQRVNHFLCVSERERERESYYLLAMRIRTIGINEQLRLVWDPYGIVTI